MNFVLFGLLLSCLDTLYDLGCYSERSVQIDKDIFVVSLDDIIALVGQPEENGRRLMPGYWVEVNRESSNGFVSLIGRITSMNSDGTATYVHRLAHSIGPAKFCPPLAVPVSMLLWLAIAVRLFHQFSNYVCVLRCVVRRSVWSTTLVTRSTRSRPTASAC